MRPGSLCWSSATDSCSPQLTPDEVGGSSGKTTVTLREGSSSHHTQLRTDSWCPSLRDTHSPHCCGVAGWHSPLYNTLFSVRFKYARANLCNLKQMQFTQDKDSSQNSKWLWCLAPLILSIVDNNSPSRPGWLLTEPQEPTCLCFPRTTIPKCTSPYLGSNPGPSPQLLMQNIIFWGFHRKYQDTIWGLMS